MAGAGGAAPVIVLGHDPSLASYGLAVVDTDRMRLVASATVKTRATDARANRLAALHAGIANQLHGWSAFTAIDLVAFEGGFVGRGRSVSLTIAEARGIGLLTAAQYKSEIIAPRAAKRMICGNGNATKDDVGEAVQRLLGLTERLQEDAADAAAVAIAAAMIVEGK
jgi:crossover junction endodeoxyribonuclease RuvC